MNPIQALKLFAAYEKLQSTLKGKLPPMQKTSQIAHLAVSIGGIIGLPVLADKWLQSHLVAYSIFAAVSLVLHFISPSIFGGPTADVVKKAGLGVVLLAMSLSCPGIARAQSEGTPANIYGAGASYGLNATPPVAGTVLYAHLLSASAGTYAFTVIDAVPNTLKPLTVTSNIGAGVAQRVFTIKNIPFYTPASGGISWTGTNVGFEWNGGIMPVVHLKGNYYLMPNVRFLKSSVSNGTGYQLIPGIVFGFGQ